MEDGIEGIKGGQGRESGELTDYNWILTMLFLTLALFAIVWLVSGCRPSPEQLDGLRSL